MSAGAYHSLGLVLDAADRFAEAEQAYRKALELSPQRALAHAWLGLNLLAQGRGDEALDEAMREPEPWHVSGRWRSSITPRAAGRNGRGGARTYRNARR